MGEIASNIPTTNNQAKPTAQRENPIRSKGETDEIKERNRRDQREDPRNQQNNPNFKPNSKLREEQDEIRDRPSELQLKQNSKLKETNNHHYIPTESQKPRRSKMASASSSSSASVIPESQAAFEQRIRQTVNLGALLPCIAIGYRLKLFEKMAEFTIPKTSQEIADSMDYKERLVLLPNHYNSIQNFIILIISAQCF